MVCLGNFEKSAKSVDKDLPQDEYAEDDWEAIADRAPGELLSSQCLPEVSNLSLEDTKVQAPKRRGRGTFSYEKNELYSDRQYDKSVVEDTGDEGVSPTSERNPDLKHRLTGITNPLYVGLYGAKEEAKYGTRHVLVLADFSPSTRTTDLEKLLEEFRDRGFVIRWVNDTVALAVFCTPSVVGIFLSLILPAPSMKQLIQDECLKVAVLPLTSGPDELRGDYFVICLLDHVLVNMLLCLGGDSETPINNLNAAALEVRNRIKCPFTVRILDEDDFLLSSISTKGAPKDVAAFGLLAHNPHKQRHIPPLEKIAGYLEPPLQRPQTSARTAQRLIAQGMGLKLPSSFGSRELKNQEEARRNRIQSRQKLRDDAWGPDDVN
ncbi:hypothetical protein Patl1_30301 [Pistacia atlantica]|uniref:Uncharacterized protein n=1 Tax=Pistacia atlantica TaxID=434234 RepID=A0ACC1AEB2_9ROSI|nr:hypothetical protein Patl1_30301 [Pistacia atlantica]